MKRSSRLTVAVAAFFLMSVLAAATALVAFADPGNCTVLYVINPYIAGPGTDNRAQSSTEVSCDIYSLTLTVNIYIDEWTGSSWKQVASNSAACNQCEIEVAVARSAICSNSTTHTYRARMIYQFPGPTWPWSSWHYSGNSNLACTT